jgi:hypothetical protein
VGEHVIILSCHKYDPLSVIRPFDLPYRPVRVYRKLMYGTGPGREDPFEPVQNTAVPVIRYGEQPYLPMPNFQREMVYLPLIVEFVTILLNGGVST